MTPVVVSSVPARTSATWSGRSAVEERDEVAAVVHRELRVRVGDRVEVRVVRVAILAAAGVDRDPVLGDERRRDVVLGRERVRGAEDDLGAAGLERPHEVGGLGRDVEAGADPQAGERPLALEALADEAQDRHLALGPLDPADALGGEAEVGDVVGGQDVLAVVIESSGLLAGANEAPERSAARSGQGEPSRWTRRSSKRTCSA